MEMTRVGLGLLMVCPFSLANHCGVEGGLGREQALVPAVDGVVLLGPRRVGGEPGPGGRGVRGEEAGPVALLCVGELGHEGGAPGGSFFGAV